MSLSCRFLCAHRAATSHRATLHDLFAPPLTSAEAPHECCRCTMGRPSRPALMVTCSGMPNLALSASTSCAVSAVAVHRTMLLRRGAERLAVLLASCLLPATNGRKAAEGTARQDGGVL